MNDSQKKKKEEEEEKKKTTNGSSTDCDRASFHTESAPSCRLTTEPPTSTAERQQRERDTQGDRLGEREGERERVRERGWLGPRASTHC